MNQGKRLEAKEVELDEPDLFHPAHFVLGDDAAFFIDEQRQMIDQRHIGKHHARGMGRSVAHQPFQTQRVVHQGLYPRVVLHELGYARLHFHRFGQWIIEPLFGRRNQLGDRVSFGEGKSYGAADIPDRCLSLEGAKSGDLCDPVGAVLVFDVLNNLGPAANAEVNIDIRHGLALGIEETLEQQNMPDRIEIGNAQRVGNQASRRRAAPRSDRNAVLASRN